MSYFPKTITASQHVSVFNGLNSAATSTQKQSAIDKFEGVSIDMGSGDATYTERVFWDIYDAVNLLPDTTDRANAISAIDAVFPANDRPNKPPQW